MTIKITTRNYRTHLLNEAAKTGDQALANLAKTATSITLKNLYISGYKLPTGQAVAKTAENFYTNLESYCV